SGICLPVRAAGFLDLLPFTSPRWSAQARPVRQVAADGATLLLATFRFPARVPGDVRLRLEPGDAAGDPGQLWAVNDARVVDTSPSGGQLDSGPAGATATLNQRTVQLAVRFPGRSPAELRETITVVRPLVIFLHGTFSEADAWAEFPLWANSANEVNGFQFQPGNL